MTQRFAAFLATSLLLFLACPSLALAQGTTGTLKGQFVDEATQAPVAAVTVTVTDSRTGLTRTMQSNANGRFWFKLPPGDYSLTSRSTDYTGFEVESVKVNVAGIADLRLPLAQSAIDEIIVMGTAAPLMTTATGEAGLHITIDELAQLPVARSIEAVSLLAPGTIPGDVAFSDYGDKMLVSFGGASVAENVYYIDGLNVTNFRNGLGGSSVPFEFYQQFQIKTGGYSAEFGRSTGGVLNAVTRRGTNEFEYGVVAYSEPDWGQGRSPDVFEADGSLVNPHRADTSESWSVDLYAGGPIIRDRLFFFVLYEPRDSFEQYVQGQDLLWRVNTDDDFWGGNLTWHVTDRHSLEFTAFSDERDRVFDAYDYDYDNGTVGDSRGGTTDFRGGDNYIVRYEGQPRDNLAVSAQYGRNAYSLTSFGNNDFDCPLVVDVRDSSTSLYPGCWVNAYPTLARDEREAYRLDIVYTLGDHVLRAGLDQEKNASDDRTVYSGTGFFPGAPGGIYYRYITEDVGSELGNGAIVPDANGDGSRVDLIRFRYHEYGGSFDTESRAVYFEDTWQIRDNLTAGLGIRYEEYANYNGVGQQFFDVDDQWAPRLGLEWLPGDSGRHHVTFNWGRYFLPMMADPNIALGGGWSQYDRFFLFDGEVDPVTAAPVAIDADRIPTTPELGSVWVRADGSVSDTREVLDTTLKPMDQYEWMIGYALDIGDDWTVGIRYIDRELQNLIEDVSIDAALAEMGYPVEIGDRYYVMTNPGGDMTTYFDTDGDGSLDQISIPADLLGYPKAKRTYQAIELIASKEFGDDWMMAGSYTWSKSRGNTEGTVKSDNGQGMANITEDFDWRQLMDGTDGYLPNDRRHKLKVWGAWQANERLLLSASLFAESGRPINKFGTEHPDGTPPYGDTYYHLLDDGSWEFTPRGSQGRTDWTTQLDLAAIYSFAMGDSVDMEFRAEVFNVFDSDAVVEVREHFGEQPTRWKLPSVYQPPRHLRFGFALRF